MQHTAPANPNYACVVVQIPAINQLEGCDNIVGAPLLGHQAIVSKDTQAGDIGVVFTAETALSEEFARVNNLYAHTHLNADPEAKGYLGDNRRVRAIKLRGHRSDALFLPLKALAYTGIDINDLKVGDTFDTLGGHEICRKYELPVKGNGRSLVEKNKGKFFTRVDSKYLPEHFSTDNYFRVAAQIPGHVRVVASQKLHGTSIRVAHTIVARKLGWRDRIAQKLGIRVAATEHDYVYASRRVIKDANANQNHFYDNDVWTHYGKRLDGLLPENYIVYGELVGWSPDGSPLQTGYTYTVPKGDAELYVYRVSVLNGQGVAVDLSWDAVKQFCADRGLKHVPELWTGAHADFEPDRWLDKRYRDEGFANAVPLEPGKTVDEGVVLRVEGLAPYFAKLKAPAFFAFETKQLDKGNVDLESLGDAA